MTYPIRFRSMLWTIALTVLLTEYALPATAQQTDTEKITFDDHVGPLLRKRCSTCHNSNEKSGDLDVTNLASLLEGGASGSGIEVGDAGSSYLVSLISYEEGPEMPPSGKIPDEEIQLIKRWIDGGALENQGSQFSPKPRPELAMAAEPLARPEQVPLPARLSLESVAPTTRAGGVIAMASSPWAPLVAIAAPGQVLLYDTQTLELTGILPIEGEANSLQFSRNGTLLLAAGGVHGAKGTAVLWNIPTGEQLASIGDELDSILAADISPDHTLVAIGGPGRVVKVFSTSDGSLMFELTKHTDWITAIEFSPDGKYLASADRSGGLQLWFAEDGSEHLTLKAHSQMIAGLSWRGDGHVLASAGKDASIRLWEVENGKQLKNWSSHVPGVTSIEFSRNGTLFTCGRDKLVRKWKQDGSEIAAFTGFTDIAVELAFCNQSNRVIAGDWTGSVNVWDGDDTQPLGHLDPNPPTLQQRLDQALAEQRQLQQQRESHQQGQAALERQLNELTGTLQRIQQKQNELGVQTRQLESRLATARQQLEQSVAQQQAWEQELAEKTEAKPIIEGSFQAALAASKALPDDAELQQTAEQLGEKIKQLIARLEELEELVTTSGSQQAQSQLQIDQLEQSLAQIKPELEQTSATVSDIQSQMHAVDSDLKKQSALVEQARRAEIAAAHQVARWQAEMEFIDELETATQELDAAVQKHAARQADAVAAARKLEEVQTQAGLAEQAASEAQRQVESVRQKIRELRRVK